MMATLILSLENVFISEYPLNKASVHIGRKSANDIHLDNLAVSGDHAMIVKSGGDFYIEDLASTNGTLVNDEFVKKQLLKNGDVIEFGKYQLKYVDDATSGVEAEKARPAFEKTMMIHPSAMKSSKAKPEVAPASIVQSMTGSETPPGEKTNTSSLALTSTASPTNSLSSLVGKIQVLNGSGSGRELVLNKTLTTLGKVGIQVAVITKRPHGYFITHVEGLTLPIVNGTSVGLQALALNDHDVIELAGVKMEFYLIKS
jgi:pSer/pThr/pTyr-binding forkhead associated (FHA) protein